MKKRLSICFLIAELTAALAIIFIIFYLNAKQNKTDIPEQLAEETKSIDLSVEPQTEEAEIIMEIMAVTLPEGAYLLKESDGYLVIYHRDGNTVFDETNIRVEFLPEEIQALIKDGLILHGEKELYDFLESYSS